MKRIMRRAGIAAVIASVVAILAPSTAFALSNLPEPSTLRRPYISGNPTGTGPTNMYNSSGQKIGEYELFVNYYHLSAYSIEFMICVRDTSANGRGVVARVLMKYGTNSSYEVGKYKDGVSCGSTMYAYITSPCWAIDVDHGETWAGTPYQYTGHYNRYASQSGSGPNWPYFA